MSNLDGDFDAFELRFSATVRDEAERMAVPDDGLDLIEERLGKRRRARRVRWLAAAAVFVLVVGIAGVTLRSAQDESAPYVTSNDMPLLGFSDQPLAVTTYVPGALYAVPDFARQNNGIVTSLSVWSDRAGGAPSIPPLADTEAITVVGQAGTLGSVTVDGRPYAVVQWSPADGYQALLSVDASLSTDPRSDAKAAAARIAAQEPATFEATLTGTSPKAAYPLSPLILDGTSSETHLLELRSGSRLTVQLGGNIDDASFVGLQVLVGDDRTDYGDRVLERPTVRDSQGEVLESSNSDGTPFRLLRWRADGRTYQLRYPTSTSTAAAVELANRLRNPSDDERHALLFPAEAVQLPGLAWFQWLSAQPPRPS